MDIWYAISLVVISGIVGGLLNCAMTGEFVMPKIDPLTRIWKVGWIGNVFIGGLSALVVWGMNGPLANFDIFSPNTVSLTLTVSQIVSNILVGMGGGNIITQMAQKQAERYAKDTLASTLERINRLK